MSYLIPTNTRHTMTPVIIYGPPASGKTRNAEAFRDYFGLSFIVDEWPATYPPVQNTLYLTTVDAPAISSRLHCSCILMPVEDALQLLENRDHALHP